MKVINRDLLGVGVINWLGEFGEFIRENALYYRNLESNSFWQLQMTDEEKEMKRHPNRSSNWIPQRLEEIRDDFRYKILDAVLGEGNYDTGRLWGNNDCKKCNSSYEEEVKFIREMGKCMEISARSRDINMMSPRDLYVEMRQDCWDKVSPSYDTRVLRTNPITNWQQGRMPFTPSRPYGFCGYCWDPIQTRMDALVMRVLQED
jgi:hypothetical protein